MAQFRKGQSGNPNGRRPGSPNRLTLSVRQAMQATFEQLQGEKGHALMDWARENTTEFYKLAARLIPPMKATDNPVSIGKLDGTLTDNGHLILGALSEGKITPDEAQTLMQTVVAQARIVEVDDLEKRIKVLEDANEKH